MFQNSGWYNLENILAVSLKTSIEIFQATTRLVSSYTVATLFFLLTLTADLGLILLIYLYSIHRAIYRPWDHYVVRPLAEIRTQDGRN